MRPALFRRILAVLAAVLILLPAAVVSEDGWSHPQPLEPSQPWWEVSPPKKRTRVVVRSAETLVESVDAEGWAYTNIRSVNVRCLPSVYATKVASIRAKGTEVSVTAKVKNSSGEIWYAVKLQNGTLGYIRSDLLYTGNVYIIDETSSAATPLPAYTATPAYPTPEVIYITPGPRPTPTPILIYLPSEPEEETETMTPEIIFATPEPPSGNGDG